jgi:hypothetical protein
MLHSIYCLSCGSILNQVGGKLTIVPLGDRTEHDYVSGLLPSFFRLHLTVREFLSVDIITKGRSRLAWWLSDWLHHSRGMDSLTLQLKTCGRSIVSQSLGTLNRYRAPSLRISWHWNNIRLISPKNMSNSRWIINNSAKWSWTRDHRWVVRVRLFFDCMAPGMTNLFLLLQRCHCSSLIFIWTYKFVMNI